ncbi:MAG: hypothetical protein U0Z53_05620 [Blastocatellia bacterium]
MEHTITVTLPDEIYQPLVEAALKHGQTPEEFAAERLAESVPLPQLNGGQVGKGDITRFFGMWDSGDLNSADNERIDADLAREYGNVLNEDQ